MGMHANKKVLPRIFDSKYASLHHWAMQCGHRDHTNVKWCVCMEIVHAIGERAQSQVRAHSGEIVVPEKGDNATSANLWSRMKKGWHFGVQVFI